MSARAITIAPGRRRESPPRRPRRTRTSHHSSRRSRQPFAYRRAENGELQPKQVDILRGKLCIGIHRDVEVTDAAGEHRPLVSQAFCSALPVAYTRVPPSHWEAFASLVLQAAYEATMAAAVLNAQRGASSVVLLTQLGGGAFGNHDDWIHAAMWRALKMMSEFALDVRLVSYGTPSREILQMAEDFH